MSTKMVLESFMIGRPGSHDITEMLLIVVLNRDTGLYYSYQHPLVPGK
jgi:hypothetical protein